MCGEMRKQCWLGRSRRKRRDTTRLRREKARATVTTQSEACHSAGCPGLSLTDTHPDLYVRIGFQISDTGLHPSQTAPWLAHAYQQRKYPSCAKSHVAHLHSASSRAARRQNTAGEHNAPCRLSTKRNDRQWSLKNCSSPAEAAECAATAATMRKLNEGSRASAPISFWSSCNASVWSNA